MECYPRWRFLGYGPSEVQGSERNSGRGWVQVADLLVGNWQSDRAYNDGGD